MCLCASQDPVDVPDTPLDEAEDLVPTILERDGVYVAGEPFPCLGALANDLSGATVGPFMEGEPIDAFAEALEHEVLEAAPEEDAAAGVFVLAACANHACLGTRVAAVDLH